MWSWERTASICCGDVENAIAYAISCAVEDLCDELDWLAARLASGRSDVCYGLLEESCVVTTARFEDELARGGAL